MSFEFKARAVAIHGDATHIFVVRRDQDIPIRWLVPNRQVSPGPCDALPLRRCF